MKMVLRSALIGATCVGLIAASAPASGQRASGVLPSKIKHVDPTYPAAALEERLHAVVLIMITVGPDGRVTDARVLQSNPVFDQAALEAVRRWEYDPKGMTGPVVGRVMVQFKPPDQSVAGAQRAPAARPGDVQQPYASRSTSPTAIAPGTTPGRDQIGGPPGTPAENPDQKLQRLTASINSESLSAEARRQARRERAFLNATTGRLGFAHQDVDALLAIDPRDHEAHFARGLAFLVGNPPQAVQAFSRVIDIEPTKVDGYRGRAWANLVAGEYAAAAKDFDQVLLIDPGDSEAYRGRGWAQLHAKNYDDAIKDFSELMRRSPGNPEASAVRGIAYYLSGRVPEARADFRSTVRHGRFVPNGALAYNTLIVDDWKRYRRILPLLAEKTTRNPTDIDALLAYGVAGAGLPAFDQAVKIKPDDVDVRMIRALFYAVPVPGTTVLGYSPPSAIADLTEVIRLKPDDSEAYFWRAVFRATDPDPQALPAAVADCEKALTLSPRDPALGALLQKLKGEQRAREQSAQQAAAARAQFEQNKEAYAAAFLVALVAMFGSSPEPPDPFRRSLVDELRTWEHFTRPCRTDLRQRC